jgi:RNA polymerase sigma-70 factor (ECF subfamily)
MIAVDIEPESGWIRHAPVQEESLLAALRAGEESAYHRLVVEYGGRMLSVSRRFLRNEEDARDALQDAFVQAWKGLPRFQGHCALGTWLHRIVVNSSLMRLRTRKTHPEESIEPLLPQFLEDGHAVNPSVQWPEPCDRLLEREEVRALVRQAIDRLPETYRTVLLMRDIEEMDTAEAAEALGITENAVKVRLHRARQALRELVDPSRRKGVA